ncbi:MAG: hypothetical protein B0A82_09035 [Alkalinema sp. CACIAM 70d]|nr:MAG: hypothetical protein B0A82_09035 [Alkalinema sp. CACIAM 70d]
MPINGEISAICDEFHEELVGLLDFAQIRKASSANSLAPRARVAAANGATLLLAALYEECIRQMVKATFNHKKQAASGINDFPDKLAASVWRRSFEKLARRPFDEVQGTISVTNSEINGVLAFCLKGDLKSDVSSFIAHNDNNMRPDEMARLFKQIGVSSIVSKLGTEKGLQDFFGIDNPSQCADALRNEIEDFFRRRNEIAHAIQTSSSSGPTSIEKDVNLFKSVTASLVKILSVETK